MATWNVPAKLPYALFVAGDERLGEAARPALDRVLASLASGPPPAVDLRTWIVEHGRMGTIPVDAVRAQIPPEALSAADDEGVAAGALAGAVGAMIVAGADGAVLDPRAPWGLLVLAATLAGASAGLVYDSGTFRVVPPGIRENPLDGFLLGSIRNHVAILSSTDAAGLQTATTLGLNKFGLFELELGGVSASAADLGMVLAGLAQAIVDARPTQPGPWEVPALVEVTRRHVAHAFAADVEPAAGKTSFAVRQGTADALFWRVEGPAGPLDATAVGAAIAALSIEFDEASARGSALAQATRIARNRLGEARDAFARRTLTQDVVLVRKAFPRSDAGTEYLWLRVEDWTRTRLSATVTSAPPSVPMLGIGDRLSLDVDEIVDWRVERRDGAALGNFLDTALNGAP